MCCWGADGLGGGARRGRPRREEVREVCGPDKKEAQRMAVQSQTETNKRFDSSARKATWGGKRWGGGHLRYQGAINHDSSATNLLIQTGPGFGCVRFSRQPGNKLNQLPRRTTFLCFFTASRVPLCENRIVYCAGRIRSFIFPGKRCRGAAGSAALHSGKAEADSVQTLVVPATRKQEVGEKNLWTGSLSEV